MIAPKSDAAQPRPSLGDMARVFGHIGVLSFGGPAAQIALMHRELVDRRPWMSEGEFLNALSFCMLLPGPEAMQLATYAGWKMRGTPGGLLAGLLFVVPGACVIAALALVYGAVGGVPLVAALFLGVKAAVVVIVIEALLKVSRRALTRPDHWAIAALSFFAIFALRLPFPLIIAAAAAFGALRATGSAQPSPPPHARPATARTIAVWGTLWATPLAVLAATKQHFLLDIGLFFSRLAIVTFGGAYAVLAYMTQQVVTEKGWLSTAQMMDALGLAETTPGPLILVTQFVAMLAGTGTGGPAMALAGGAVALWVTFVPCFLWIFAGAPWLDRIAARPRLTGALSAITAAVVGVIANLSIWFAAHVLFARVDAVAFGPVTLIAPDAATLSLPALGLGILAAILLLWRHWPLPMVLAVSAGAGAAAGALGLI